MQRRRLTPQNNAAPFTSPFRHSSNQNQSPYGTSPGNGIGRAQHASSWTNGGIELRDRSFQATSSGISRPTFYRAFAAESTGNAYRPPSYTYPSAADAIFIMKPLVGAMQAWSCVVISVFAIIILSILGLLFRSNHHEMVGGVDDPKDGPEVAATIFIAVLVYAGFLVFCGLQGLLHLRENRRGAIAL